MKFALKEFKGKLKPHIVYVDENGIKYCVRNKELHINGECVQTAKSNKILLDQIDRRI